MNNRISKTAITATLLSLLTAGIVVSGCHHQTQPTPKESPVVLDIERIVVLGFQPATLPGGESGPTHSPISGSVFMAEPTGQSVADRLTVQLFDKLVAAKSFDLVSPGQARGVFSSIIGSGSLSGDVEVAKKIGKAFSSQAVLMGYTYRWREREGTNYAVKSPASAAFDLYLINASDGRILWKGKFDKTQRSLSENLLDMNTFIKGKGKWMTVEELAAMGLEGLLLTFPNGMKSQEK